MLDLHLIIAARDVACGSRGTQVALHPGNANSQEDVFVDVEGVRGLRQTARVHV